ncbi:acyltransferase [Paenibacillus aurantius]|uniref:Acyltransferase n=1 Tax=Paenibacillus aurantius TaxID=2918900 RepID=A0AA96LE33_9BACL|nr:acyltransferase [Paenibacillus aurantius]WNQ11528.1 acyltransferase [Paenibacillus aurantius]
MRKERITELETVRALAILAVLVIHVTASGTVELPSGGVSRGIYLVLNKLSNFSVPAFVLMSGLVLFYRYGDDWGKGQAAAFYRKRLQYIVLPYLVWSGFYIVYNRLIHGEAVTGITLSRLGDNLLWGEASYHLYFIVLIVQYYALFPLLMAAAKKGGGGSLLLIGLVLQAGAFYYNHAVAEIPHRSAFGLTYLGEFCIGGALGLGYREWISRLKPRQTAVWALSGLLGAGLAWIHLAGPDRFSWGPEGAEAIVHAYSVAVSVALLLAGSSLLRSSPGMARFLTALGAASFGVYLIHPAVLTAWAVSFSYPPGSPAYHLSNAGAFAVGLAVSWGVFLLLRRAKAGWVLLGK